MSKANYSKNIFINCPFDPKYSPILDSILFVCIFYKLEPQMSQTSSSMDSRMEKIVALIKKSKYSIHDISRMNPEDEDDSVRFNMPFELGVDYGCKHYLRPCSDKLSLVFERTKYSYQKVISDLSGCDLFAHEGSPEIAVKFLRNWLYNVVVESNMEEIKAISPTDLWTIYNEFQGDFSEELANQQWTEEDIRDMTISEKIEGMTRWVRTKHENLKVKFK